MIPRVTSATQMRSAQANLQASAQRLAQLQEQSSSLKTISRASDDPARAANALAVRAEQRATAQYTRNADNGNGWLTTLDTALGASTTILTRVRDLTVQGANAGTMSPAAREAIAVEIDGLKQDLLTQANASYLGRSVFAGNSDAGVAFKAGYIHTADSPAGVERRVGADSTVRVDADGAAIFGNGTESVFALLATVSDALRNAPAAVSSRIESASAALVSAKGSLEAQRVQLEDADLATVILDLKLQEVAYQSALAVTARVIQPTLMDFLS